MSVNVCVVLCCEFTGLTVAVKLNWQISILRQTH